MAGRVSKSNPCSSCSAICCRYIALPIDKPQTAGDFDDIRWYLAHEKVSVFVDDGDWYISFTSRCRYLTKDLRCRIYADRPRICRNYKTKDCEFIGEGDAYDMIFNKPEDIEQYAKEFLRKKYRRTGRARRTGGRKK